MPCVFVCDAAGFIEPNLACILSHTSKLLAIHTKFSERIENFLNNIWKKYGNTPSKDLTSYVKNTPAYKENYILGSKNIVNLKTLAASFAKDGKLPIRQIVNNTKKILLSQNGPVIVSQWQ